MSIYPVKGKKILVFGLARSGMAAVSWLHHHGAFPLALDNDPEKQQKALELGAVIVERDHLFGDDLAAVVQSPGIPLTHELTQRALQANIPVISDCDLFRQANPKAFVVGITGTNGKSTTTALIGHILKYAGYPVAVGGNIGVPVLSLPPLGDQGIYVLELSSYQLELSNHLNINIVAWLNISEDHLDRHGTIEQYVQAKDRIFHPLNHFPKAVIGIDDPYSYEIYKRHCSSPLTIPVSCRQQIEEGIWVRKTHLLKREGDREILLANLDQYKPLQGIHNSQNMAIAYGVCVHIGVEATKILEGIRTFSGLVHRQEFVAEFENVTFINDSKATNANASSKALEVYENIYWIAGGLPKKEGIQGLKSFFPRIQQVFLFGTARHEFAKTLETMVSYKLFESLEEAVFCAYARARASSKKITILFSPACASFDQFRDFEHRGEVFKHLVFDVLTAGNRG